jgi:probable phosphoglycerate mutase
MPTLLLIRHGENDYFKEGRLPGRLTGIHLNARGIQQAEHLGQMLAAAPIAAVYASPLDRTMETAAPIARAKGLAVIPRDGLIELDCGDWAGETLKSLRRLKLWRTAQQRPSMMHFPGGETFAAAQQRIVGELDTLCRQNRPRDLIVCVSHSDPLKLAIAYHTCLPLDLFQRLTIAPASVSTLHMGEGHAQLINLNVLNGLDFPARRKGGKGKPH